MINYSEDDIRQACGHNAFIRGKKYFEQGRVIRLLQNDLEEDLIELIGVVSGSEVYRQNIEIYHGQAVEISSYCSCPVGFNCKHVVAVLMKHLHSLKCSKQKAINLPVNQSTQAKLLNRWFDEFSDIASSSAKPTASQPNKFLAYLLTESTTPGEIQIDLLRTGHKKKGGYYKPQVVNIDNLATSLGYYNTPDYIQTQDQIIVTLLNTQRDRYFYAYKPLLFQGEIGKQVLDKMIASNRCFWGDLAPDCLISTGATVATRFRWQKVGKAKKQAEQLMLGLAPNIRIIPVEPPHYINIENKQVGKLDTGLTLEQFNLLKNMPAVPQKMLKEVSLKLVSNDLDQAIPLPVAIDIQYLEGQHLTPKVVMSNLNLDGLKVPHCLIISYLYEEFEVQVLDNDNLNTQRAGRYFKINRDLDTEKYFFEQLVSLGFEAIQYDNNKIALVAPINKNHQQQLHLWKTFTQQFSNELRAIGWLVEFAEEFNLSFIQTDEQWDMAVQDENDWFSLKFDLCIAEGQKLPLIPLVSPLLADYGLDNIPDEILVETQQGQFITLEKRRVLPILNLLYELFDSVPTSQDTINVSKFDALQINRLAENDEMGINWLGGKKLRKLGEKLANFTKIKNVSPSKKFQGDLRDYQQQGLNWLQFLREFEFCGLLADDMGLGKTVQTLVHLQKEKMAKRMNSPCLIIAPTSLMSNWKRESQQFTPNLKVLVLQGAERHLSFSDIENSDLVLTTYPLIVRDYKVLSQQSFYAIVLDEAQNIKNPKSKATQLIKSLVTQHKVALTGTPMENHLGEMWSIFDFLMPGFLGSEASFRKKYRTPIEKHENQQLAQMLSKRVRPFLLRRTKERVAKALPAKTSIIKSAVMNDAQATLYETIRIAMEKKIEQALAQKGLNRSHITILDALLKLRQVCCDPQLLKLSQAKKVKSSAKLELLMSMLPELIEEGRRILVFSQFTSMLKLIEAQLSAKNIEYTKLTGRTKNREQAIETFTSGKVPLFLISLKAGGVGLNLTEADTVIHYDPWWNPAVENQASDRAHRIGQDKPVFVYKLIVENTLEEKILEMQARKQALADGVYGKSKGKKQSALTKEDIAELLASSR